MKTTFKCTDLDSMLIAINSARSYGKIHYKIHTVGWIFKSHYVDVSCDKDVMDMVYKKLHSLRAYPFTATTVGTSTETKTLT